MTRVFTSAVINAHIEQVWMKIRDFNALPNWHPAIANSYIENGEPSDKVGCIRNFNLKAGGNIREKLLVLNDLDYLFSYSILESPMPLTNYVATFQLKPITEGDRTYAEWTAIFDCDSQDEKHLMKLIGDGVFQTGFNALNQIVKEESRTVNMADAQDWIEKLKLDQLEEVGGYFRSHLKSEKTLSQIAGSEGGNDRRLWDVNYYLLQNNDVTALHQLKQDEIWHFYDGKPLALHLFPNDGNYQKIKLGSNVDAGEVFQAVAPQDTWFGATLLEPNSFALVGTTLVPGWHSTDSIKPNPNQLEKLIKIYPQYEELINRLTLSI